MKKSLLPVVAAVLILVLAPSRLSAQETVQYSGSLSDFYEGRARNEAGHLQFQGIAVDGPLADCIKRLKAVKFRQGKDKTEPVMRGPFGNETVTLQLGTLPRADLVYVFMITYPPKATWSALANQYESVKMKLTALYGQPTVIDEMVPGAYITVISTPQGDVTLATGEDYSLRIYLVDKENNEIGQLMEEGR